MFWFPYQQRLKTLQLSRTPVLMMKDVILSRLMWLFSHKNEPGHHWYCINIAIFLIRWVTCVQSPDIVILFLLCRVVLLSVDEPSSLDLKVVLINFRVFDPITFWKSATEISPGVPEVISTWTFWSNRFTLIWSRWNLVMKRNFGLKK